MFCTVTFTVTQRKLFKKTKLTITENEFLNLHFDFTGRQNKNVKLIKKAEKTLKHFNINECLLPNGFPFKLGKKPDMKKLHETKIADIIKQNCPNNINCVIWADFISEELLLSVVPCCKYLIVKSGDCFKTAARVYMQTGIPILNSCPQNELQTLNICFSASNSANASERYIHVDKISYFTKKHNDLQNIYNSSEVCAALFNAGKLKNIEIQYNPYFNPALTLN